MKFPLKYQIHGFRDGPGIYVIPLNKELFLWCIASFGGYWDHVSVTIKRKKGKKVYDLNRCPTWDEMCKAKQYFWDDDQEVMQLHPAAGENVSTHPYCLHLWRPQKESIPMPPAIFVGLPGDNVQEFKPNQK